MGWHKYYAKVTNLKEYYEFSGICMCILCVMFTFLYFSYGKIDDYDIPPFVMQNFHQYDANADGYIDPNEFMMVAQDLKLTDANGIPLVCILEGLLTFAIAVLSPIIALM